MGFTDLTGGLSMLDINPALFVPYIGPPINKTVQLKRINAGDANGVGFYTNGGTYAAVIGDNAGGSHFFGQTLFDNGFYAFDSSYGAYYGFTASAGGMKAQDIYGNPVYMQIGNDLNMWDGANGAYATINMYSGIYSMNNYSGAPATVQLGQTNYYDSSTSQYAQIYYYSDRFFTQNSTGGSNCGIQFGTWFAYDSLLGGVGSAFLYSGHYVFQDIYGAGAPLQCGGIISGTYGNLVVDVVNMGLFDMASNPSLDWQMRMGISSTGTITIDYENMGLFALSGVATIYWGSCQANDFASALSHDWNARKFQSAIGNFIMDYSGNRSTSAGVSFDSLNNLCLSKKLTYYNNLATVSNGIPAEYATVDLTAQSAAKTATTLYTPNASGMFRISIALQVTRAATTSSVLGGATGVVITYTEPDGSVAQSIVPLLTSQAGAVIVPATGNVGNTTATQSQGSAIIYAKTGVAIQYAIGYTSVGVTSMTYSAHLKLEAL